MRYFLLCLFLIILLSEIELASIKPIPVKDTTTTKAFIDSLKSDSISIVPLNP